MTENARGTFAPHVPCNCTPHCELKHGDQADPEFDTLRALTQERDSLRVDLANARAEVATEKAITARLVDDEREACADILAALTKRLGAGNSGVIWSQLVNLALGDIRARGGK